MIWKIWGTECHTSGLVTCFRVKQPKKTLAIPGYIHILSITKYLQSLPTFDVILSAETSDVKYTTQTNSMSHKQICFLPIYMFFTYSKFVKCIWKSFNSAPDIKVMYKMKPSTWCIVLGNWVCLHQSTERFKRLMMATFWEMVQINLP